MWYSIPCNVSWKKSLQKVAIPGVMVIFRSITVLRCQFGAFCLSVQSILIKPKYQMWLSFANLQLEFLELCMASPWAMLFRPLVKKSIRYFPTSWICLTRYGPLLPTSVSPLSWSQVLMDVEEVDGKRYRWCQGRQSPQFCSVNRIATKTPV